MATTASTTSVQELYIAYFGRPADATGLAFYADALDAGTTTVSAIATSFGSSTEAATIVALDTSAYVTAVYLQAFGRAYVSSTDGTFWTDAITAGTTTKELAMVEILNGATGTDATAVTNKVTVANVYTTAVTTGSKSYEGATAIAAAKAVLSAVTATASTATTGSTAAQTAVNSLSTVSAGTGQSFILTANADVMTGTALDDTFTGVNRASTTVATDTLTVLDTITGGAGVDTLNTTNTATNTDILDGAMISGIEIVNIRSTAGTGTLDASALVGHTTVNANISAGVVTVTNMAANSVANVTGNGVLTNGASNFGMAATTGVAQTLNIKSSTAGAIVLTGTAVLTTTINATGATNVTGAITAAATSTSLTINTEVLTAGNLTAAGATTVNLNASGKTTYADFLTTATTTVVNITGAGAVKITGAIDNGVTTVNAGTTTGGVFISGSDLVTFTGTFGSGNDTFTTGAILTTGSVAMGAGTGDLLILGNINQFNTTALSAKYTGFEILEFDGDMNMNLAAGVTAIRVGASDSITNMTAAQAADVTLLADSAAATFALKTATGTSDTLNLKMGTGLTTAEAVDYSAALVVTGFEILNLTTNAGPTAAAGATGSTSDFSHAFTGATLNTINLFGNAFTFADLATTVAVAVDGSALTGDGAATTLGLTTAGTMVAGSSVIGTDFVDSFTIAAEGSTFTGGAGNDIFSTTVALSLADGTTDLHMDAGTGIDTLIITGAVTAVADDNFVNVTGMEKLQTTGTGSHSITGSSAMNAAFANGLTYTGGELANESSFVFSYGNSTIDTSITIDGTDLVGDAAAEDITVTTGSGNDTVAFNGDATFVGHASTGATITLNTGAGNDIITFAAGAVLHANTNAVGSIDAGTGADVITISTISGANTEFSAVQVIVQAGDSILGTHDKITGFTDADSAITFSDYLDFDGTSAAATLGSSTDFGTILSHSITTGIATFDDQAAFGTALIINAANLADVIGYSAANTATDDVLAFIYDSNNDGSADSTIVYHNGATDSVVELTGLLGSVVVNTGTMASVDGNLGIQ